MDFDKDEVMTFSLYDNNDYDEDGHLLIFYDKCSKHSTRNCKGTLLGCPIDTDGDGLADYLDKGN